MLYGRIVYSLDLSICVSTYMICSMQIITLRTCGLISTYEFVHKPWYVLHVSLPPWLNIAGEVCNSGSSEPKFMPLGCIVVVQLHNNRNQTSVHIYTSWQYVFYLFVLCCGSSPGSGAHLGVSTPTTKLVWTICLGIVSTSLAVF